MKEKDIFKEKAENGYIVCFADNCTLKECCLRYLVGQKMPDTTSTYRCVNPRFQDVGTANCSLYRKAEKVKYAKGMTHLFNEDMPKRIEPYVRQHLINSHCRTYYYEFRNGERLIPPTVQEEIRQYFREAGWNGDIHFDGFVEDYEW